MQDWNLVVDCLRKVPADKFASLEGLGDLPFVGPNIDGDFLPKSVRTFEKNY